MHHLYSLSTHLFIYPFDQEVKVEFYIFSFSVDENLSLDAKSTVIHNNVVKPFYSISIFYENIA